MIRIICLLLFLVFTLTDAVPETYSQQSNFNLYPEVTQFQYFNDQKHLIFLCDREMSNFHVWTGSINYPYRKTITIKDQNSTVALRQFSICPNCNLVLFLSEEGRVYGFQINNTTGQIDNQFKYWYDCFLFGKQIQYCSFSFSEDNKIAVSINQNVYLLDIPSQPGKFQQIAAKTYQTISVKAMAWIPNDNSIIIGSTGLTNNSIIIYHIHLNEQNRSETQNTTCLLFLDDVYIIRGSAQNNLKLYSYFNQTMKFQFISQIPDSANCKEIKLSENKKYFVVKFKNTTVVTWKVIYNNDFQMNRLALQEQEKPQTDRIKPDPILRTNTQLQQENQITFGFAQIISNKSDGFTFSKSGNQIILLLYPGSSIFSRWTLCKDHQYLSNNGQECLNCSMNCQRCINQPNQCTQCLQNQYLNVTSWTCPSCQLFLLGCIDCNYTGLSCTSCNSSAKFVRKPLDNKCVCPQNSSRAIKKIIVDENYFYSECACIDSYYENKNGNCQQCDLKQICLSCVDEQTCTLCNQTYYFQKLPLNGVCVCKTNFVLNSEGTQCICNQEDYDFSIDGKCINKSYLIMIIAIIGAVILVIALFIFIICRIRKNKLKRYKLQEEIQRKDIREDDRVDRGSSKSILSQEKRSILQPMLAQQKIQVISTRKREMKKQVDDALYQQYREEIQTAKVNVNNVKF